MINRFAGPIGLAVVLLCLAALPAQAQFQARRVSNPATGESYHVELAGGLWFPTADITIANTAPSQTGTDIDLKSDLGLVDKRFGQYDAVFRPAVRHKIRVQYIPIKYTQSATPTRTLVFNGRTYTSGIEIRSDIDWKAYRFGYEYDFVSADNGFVGVIVEAKYTQLDATLTSALIGGVANVKAPIPAVGGIARIYLTSHISVTGEVTGIKIPRTSTIAWHYGDYDIYGTLNFSNQLGLQGGYRSFDVDYLVKENSGSMTLKGNYVNLVIRF